jgi:hypothetical protein
MLPGTTLSIACACCDSLRIPSLVFSLSRLRFSDAAENSHVLIALHLGTLICLSFEHTIAQDDKYWKLIFSNFYYYWIIFKIKILNSGLHIFLGIIFFSIINLISI